MPSLDMTEFKIGLSQWTGSRVANLRRSKPYRDLVRLCAQSNSKKKTIFRDFRPLTFLGKGRGGLEECPQDVFQEKIDLWVFP